MAARPVRGAVFHTTAEKVPEAETRVYAGWFRRKDHFYFVDLELQLHYPDPFGKGGWTANDEYIYTDHVVPAFYSTAHGEPVSFKYHHTMDRELSILTLLEAENEPPTPDNEHTPVSVHLESSGKLHDVLGSKAIRNDFKFLLTDE